MFLRANGATLAIGLRATDFIIAKDSPTVANASKDGVIHMTGTGSANSTRS